MGMTLRMQGYYAILDMKGPSLDLAAACRHASELLAAQPCCLQLRAKQLSLAAMCELGHALRPLCTKHGVPLCVNDRLDVALAVAADVIHLGQNDLPLVEVLKVRSTACAGSLVIGVSTHTLDQAKSAAAGGADYIGYGPVFPTNTKSDADPVVGLVALQEAAAAVSIPVVAIGGITLDNVAAVARAGASAAAAIAAIDSAADRILAGRSIAQAFA
jgi:thiamine-phosphate pyrophosphorylase